MALQQRNGDGDEGWWPVGKDNQNGWRLDIVSLLAVIGESSMAEHSQAMTASWIGCLPRIIPAPQVLLKPTRPTRMPHSHASVVGVKNGIQVPTLNYFPNILHPVEDLAPFSFRVYTIKHSRQALAAKDDTKSWRAMNSRHNTTLPRHNGFSTTARNFLRRAWLRRRPDEEKAPIPLQPLKPAPHVPARTLSPLNLLSIFSCVVTWVIFGVALYNNDAIACLALVAISLVSTIVGYASLWSPQLMRRTSGAVVPEGDVVIRTREGAFIVVKCDENVARELYTGTEECTYLVHSIRAYRTLIGIATFILMLAVVLLGNCNFNQQAAIGSAYIVLNGLYWAASLVPKRKFWDLKLYELADVTPDECRDADRAQEGWRPDDVPSFTRTMWYAIRVTGEVGWVRTSGAAPKTREWMRWLAAAEEQVKGRKPGWERWKAVEAKDKLIGQTGGDEEELKMMAVVGEEEVKMTAVAGGEELKMSPVVGKEDGGEVVDGKWL
ncbi:hypothetical protein VE03_02843 [Pseudogymnoascus sp. 23342-1-I1]|nr:hypothetical protein VE03_02843 [Pseudogymnoascus sp. 23342-1-I1]